MLSLLFGGFSPAFFHLSAQISRFTRAYSQQSGDASPLGWCFLVKILQVISPIHYSAWIQPFDCNCSVLRTCPKPRRLISFLLFKRDTAQCHNCAARLPKPPGRVVYSFNLCITTKRGCFSLMFYLEGLTKKYPS